MHVWGCWPPMIGDGGGVCKTMKKKKVVRGGVTLCLMNDFLNFFNTLLKKTVHIYHTKGGARSWVRGCKKKIETKCEHQGSCFFLFWWWGFCVHFQKPVLCTLVAHGRRCVCKQARGILLAPFTFLDQGEGRHISLLSKPNVIILLAIEPNVIM